MSRFLEGYRVLDLAEGGATLCGRILGDFGADVLKIEPPNGCSTRSAGPFHQNIPSRNRSLYWLAYNCNKRGISLDITLPDGSAIFQALTRSAHFIVESFYPGYMESLGLGFDHLSDMSPGVVLVSTAPFGQTGPYAKHKASDNVAMALSGHMFTMGDTDRPPVRISFPQADLNGGAEAATGALLAHYHRETTGVGQHVDISVQQALVWLQFAPAQNWEIARRNPGRTGHMATGRSGATSMQQWPCSDGYITFDIRFAAMTGTGLRPLFDWMEEEGLLTSGLRQLGEARDSTDLDSMTTEQFEALSQNFSEFFLSHTTMELHEGATQRQIMLMPVNTMSEVLSDPQLAAREFFTTLAHPEFGDTLAYPGPFAQVAPQPMSILRTAPQIGEHNTEVYLGELGLTRRELVALSTMGVI